MLGWLLPNHSWPAQDAVLARSLERPKLAMQRDHLANGVSFLEPRAVIMSCVLLRGDAQVPALAGGLKPNGTEQQRTMNVNSHIKTYMCFYTP